MLTLLGVALGIMVFCWARELFGYWPATVALALYTMEPNTLAHSSLITADSGLACFVFGASYFLWRTTRLLSPGNLIGLSGFTALALVSKFWGLLLLPMISLLLTSRLVGRTPWPCRIGAIRELVSTSGKFLAISITTIIVLLTSYLGIWAAYDFRYNPAGDGSEQFHLEKADFVQQRVPQLAEQINWLDQTHFLPNAYTQGFLFGSATLQGRTNFLNGQNVKGGWWYYFPEAFLIKTPVILLLLLLAGTILWLRQWRISLRDSLFVFLPPLAFFLVVVSGSVDIGLRYVVLVYPFVALIAARSVVECFKYLAYWVAPTVITIAACELGLVYPHCIAYFNCLVGGPTHGYNYLVDSNLDWGQDLKGLKQWMDAKGVDHINLDYFGTADPDYYHINHTYLSNPKYAVQNEVGPPQLPGYVAVSATHSINYRLFVEQKPAAVIGYSIYVFWVDKN